MVIILINELDVWVEVSSMTFYIHSPPHPSSPTDLTVITPEQTRTHQAECFHRIQGNRFFYLLSDQLKMFNFTQALKGI